MTGQRRQIENLVMQIQTDFLDHPALALTLETAQQRFGVDGVACAAVLGALVDGQVLTQRDGCYRRHFPRSVAGHAA